MIDNEHPISSTQFATLSPFFTELLPAFLECGDYIIQPRIGVVYVRRFEAAWPLIYLRYLSPC